MARLEGRGYWVRTRLVAISILVPWLVIGVVLPMLVAGAERPRVFGLPPNGFLSGLALPVAFVALAFWFVRRQEVADRDATLSDRS